MARLEDENSPEATRPLELEGTPSGGFPGCYLLWPGLTGSQVAMMCGWGNVAPSMGEQSGAAVTHG